MTERKLPTSRSKRKRPPAKPDVNQTAYALVQAITGAEPVNGEDLLGSPELKRQLREAKEKDKARSITRIKRAKVVAAKS